MKKILVISTTQRISGAEVVLKNYLISNKKYNFYIFTSSKKVVREFYKDIINPSQIYTNKNMKSFLLKRKPYLVFEYLYSLISSVIQLKKIVKENDIEIIYGNNSTDVALLLLFKFFAKKDIKIISHIHDSLDISKLPGIYLKFFHNLIDRYIVPSKSTKYYLQNIIGDDKDISVVYNGVKIQDRLSFKDNVCDSKVIKFGFVGALNKRKRPDLFLKIIRAIKDKGLDCKGFLAGPYTKSQHQNISKKIDLLNLNINILGPIPHNKISNFYKKMDCIILTSDKDPLPTVLIEAMSHGRLVAARDVDGVKEIVEDDKNGIVFPFDFDEEEVAEKIISVISNKKKLNNILDNAFITVKEKFSNESKKNKIEHILDGFK